MGVRLD